MIRGRVPLKFPAGFRKLQRALNYWHLGGWDDEGIDWWAIRNQVNHPLRTALADGTLSAFAFTEDGRLTPVPTHLWSGNYLWGEAYDSSLVALPIAGGIKAYLVVERHRVEELKVAETEAVLRTEAGIASLIAEAPAIGLVVEALFSDEVDTKSVDAVNRWVRPRWPSNLNVTWNPDAQHAPGLVRHVNVMIRKAAVFPKYVGRPSDPIALVLAGKFPIVGAALEVYRLCSSGEMDNKNTGRVLPRTTKKALVERVGEYRHLGGNAAQVLVSAARLATPENMVSGGGGAARAARRSNDNTP